MDVSRYHLFRSTRGALPYEPIFRLLLAGLKGTGLKPVAVASLLLDQLHHKPELPPTRNGKGNSLPQLDERKDNIDEEARTIELSFSSEAPVERVFGNEVLEHSSDAAVGPPTATPIR